MKATLRTQPWGHRCHLFRHPRPKTVASFTGLATGSREYRDDKGSDQPDPVLRRADLPPDNPRVHDPGRLPAWVGHRWPGYTFDDEIHPDLGFTKPYLLAMANAGKRMGRGTNGSQFFITVAPTTGCRATHTIFGEVADQPKTTTSSTPSPRCAPVRWTGRSPGRHRVGDHRGVTSRRG